MCFPCSYRVFPRLGSRPIDTFSTRIKSTTYLTYAVCIYINKDLWYIIYICWLKRTSLSKGPLFLPNSLISQRLSHFPPSFGFPTCLQFVRLGSDESVNSWTRWTRAPSFSHACGIVQNRWEYNNEKTQENQEKQTYLRRGFSSAILDRKSVV